MSDLPELDAREQEFAVKYVTNGGNASQAYRDTHDVSEWKPNSIWTEASKLKNKPEVRQWIRALRSAGAQGAKLTVNQFIAEMAGLAERAEAAKNYGAAAKCWEMAGRASGCLDTTVNVNHTHTRKEEEILKELADLEKSTGVADELARLSDRSLH